MEICLLERIQQDLMAFILANLLPAGYQQGMQLFNMRRVSPQTVVVIIHEERPIPTTITNPLPMHLFISIC